MNRLILILVVTWIVSERAVLADELRAPRPPVSPSNTNDGSGASSRDSSRSGAPIVILPWRTEQPKNPAGSPTIRDVLAELAKNKGELGTTQEATADAIPPQGFMDAIFKDPKVKDAYRRYVIAQYERNAEIVEERKRIIGRANMIDLFIGTIAHLLLGAAVYAAWREYQQANRLRARETNLLSSEPPQEKIKLSLEGLSLQTSLHGTVLLVLAIGFYFIYVRFILPVNIVP